MAANYQCWKCKATFFKKESLAKMHIVSDLGGFFQEEMPVELCQICLSPFYKKIEAKERAEGWDD